MSGTLSTANAVQRTTSGTIKATAGTVHGVSFSDLGAAGAGAVNLRDGGAAGAILWTIGVAASQYASHSVSFGPRGIAFNTDIYAELVGGVAPKISVSYR